jgi:TPR repeat protein/S1-C subfamily serine protease
VLEDSEPNDLLTLEQVMGPRWQEAPVIGDLFGLFSKEPTPDPNEYSQLRVSAEQGDPNAQYRWAIYQYRTAKDARSMVDWLRKAASQNHVKAQIALGNCYRYAVGVPKDASEAVSWYRKAAELGYVAAQSELARMYRDGDGVPKDLNEAIKWLKRAAHQSPPDDQYDLAKRFQRGDGIPQDSNEALYWYTKAAERGHAEAQYELGKIYDSGRIRPKDVNDPSSTDMEIPKNPSKAAMWWTKAAEQGYDPATVSLWLLYPEEAAKYFSIGAEHGSVEAQYRLGGMYHEGEGVPRDYAQAVKWLTKAAEQGDSSAQKELALMYHTGDGVRQDYPEAAKWWTKAAQAGDGAAQHRLGLMYLSGLGVPKDPQEALKWLTEAAEQGEIRTQILLGLIYSGRRGAMPANHTVGFEAWKEENLRLKACAESWFKRAASNPLWQYIENEVEGFHKHRDLPRPAPYSIQDNAETVYLLAILYHTVYPGPPDHTEAAKWFTMAAEQGLPQAQTVLGEIYENGDGVPKDAGKAAKWYAKAAEQGVAEAQFDLGGMYVKDDGVPKNDKEALKWFTKAAEQGHARAQKWLGMCYERGWIGALEDYVEAYKWFLLAEMNDAGSGFSGLKERLRKEMTPSQIAEAQRAAKAFLGAQQLRSGEGGQNREAVTTAASGFFVTPAGYLLTARHAVEKAARVEVIHREKTYPAKVILQDESTDVAVLKVEGSEFPCLPLASSGTVKAGDSVFTMGFPQVRVQGIEAKFTEGSISALSGVGGSPRFFQISVPIQPGNSGGPLVNEKGEVVGLIVSRLDDVAALMATGAVPQTVNYALKSSFILPLIESIPGLTEKLPKGSAAKDRSPAIENARQAVVLIVGYGEGADSKGSSPP